MNSEQPNKKIIEATRALAKYDLHVWEKAGPIVQIELLNSIKVLTPAERKRDRPLISAICEELLSPDIEGSTWSADSVSLQRGTVPATPEVIKIRNDAISILIDYLAISENDTERRSAILSLRSASETGSGPKINDDFLNLTLTDGERIARAIADSPTELSYELMQTIEHTYLYKYRRARGIRFSEARKSCHEAAKNLMVAIDKLQEKFNSDPTFAKFKVLVGYESVFPFQWKEDKGSDEYTATELYRTNQSNNYIREIDSTNEADYFNLIERISLVESNDLATFPPFTRFLKDLSRERPETSERLLRERLEVVSPFLPAILAGLQESGNNEIYSRQIEAMLISGRELSSVARQLRISDSSPNELKERVLNRAIEVTDSTAVTELLLDILEDESETSTPNLEILEAALNYLNTSQTFWWARAPWLASRSQALEKLSFDHTRLLIPALVQAETVNYQIEQILIQISRRHPSLVWECFAARFQIEKEGSKERYQATPYEFHGLEAELSKHASSAVNFGRNLFENDKDLFRFRGGRLISSIFTGFSSEISNELIYLIVNGTKDDAFFCLAILENYHGEETTHDVLKTLIEKYPGDEDVRTGVIVSIENTGVVMGEFGFAEALRVKLQIAREWQSDTRPEVQAFATEHASSLTLRIAEEQRRAEQRQALHKLAYDLPPRKS